MQLREPAHNIPGSHYAERKTVSIVPTRLHLDHVRHSQNARRRGPMIGDMQAVRMPPLELLRTTSSTSPAGRTRSVGLNTVSCQFRCPNRPRSSGLTIARKTARKPSAASLPVADQACAIRAAWRSVSVRAKASASGVR